MSAGGARWAVPGRALGLVLALVLAARADAQPPAAPASAAATPAAVWPGTATATPMPAPASAASAPAVFSVDARLPPVTVGRVYPPLPLVRSGAEAFRFEASADLAPSGLVLGPGAVLQGRAAVVGTYRFTLTVRARDSGALVARLPFAVQVHAPPVPQAASAASASAPAEPPPAPLEDPVALFWRLDPKALEPLYLDDKRVGSALRLCQDAAQDDDALEACPAQAQAALDAVRAALKPLLGRSYPTVWMFEAALAGVPDAALPAALRAQLPALARQARAPQRAPLVRWTGDHCGCGPAVSESLSYGLYPFWAGDGSSRAVDFSAFQRIGVQGLFLQTDGSVVPHAHWDDDAPDGLRAAQRHGTRLDLVLYRQEWGAMLAQSEARLDEAARAAARAAAQQLERSHLMGWRDRLLRGLLAAWHPPGHLYDGITLWLDYWPEAGPGAPPTPRDARFARFAGTLTDALIAELAAAGRPLMLHIVVPADGLARSDGPWSLAALIPRVRPAAKPGEPPPPTVRLLVLMQPPVDQTDWRLRDAIFRSTAVQRDALENEQVPDLLVQSLLPVTPLPPPGELSGPDAPAARLLQKQLADHDWQYGGVALWPLPTGATREERTPAELLRQALRGYVAWDHGQSALADAACPWVCPNRTGLRLAFQGLVLLALAALGLWALDCRVNALGWRYLGAVVVVVALAVGIGLALLACDPDLHALSESNLLLAGLLALLLGGALWQAFRRRIPKP